MKRTLPFAFVLFTMSVIGNAAGPTAVDVVCTGCVDDSDINPIVFNRAFYCWDRPTGTDVCAVIDANGRIDIRSNTSGNANIGSFYVNAIHFSTSIGADQGAFFHAPGSNEMSIYRTTDGQRKFNFNLTNFGGFQLQSDDYVSWSSSSVDPTMPDTALYRDRASVVRVNDALRLHPRATPPSCASAADEGILYYDDSGALCACVKTGATSWAWTILAGAGACS